MSCSKMLMILIVLKDQCNYGQHTLVSSISNNFIPSLDIDPLLRHTLWTQLVGGLFYWVQVGDLFYLIASFAQ